MRKLKLLRLLCLLSVVFCHCKNANNDKIACNAAVQKELQKEKIYTDILKSAAEALTDLKNKDGRIPYKDDFLIDSAVLDENIFFNGRKNKCLLLVLQQTKSDLKSDQVRIVQGTLINNLWIFSYDRLPEVPEVIYLVKKTIKDAKQAPNTFGDLSASGQKFVLAAGNPPDGKCLIDEQYWFGKSR